MKKALTIILALVVVGAVIGIAVYRRPSQPQHERLTIGVILPLTGKAATYGERSLQGIQTAVDILNEKRTEDGNIAVIVEDSRSEPSVAVTAFQKLVTVDRVPVIVGLLTSGEALACAPLAMEKKIVILSPGATASELKEAGEYVFRNRESVELQTEVIAKACVAAVPKGKIVIMNANAANAVSYRDTFKDACDKLGADVVGSLAFNEGKSDYRSELEQLRALTPDAVYLAGYDSELGIILKQARELGIETRFFASAGAVTPKLLEIAGEGAEGLIAASATFDPSSDEPHIKTFVDAYIARFGKQPEWLAANSYDAITMVSAVTESGDYTSAGIRKGLQGMTEFPGVAGATTFDVSGGVVKPIELVCVSNGVFSALHR